MRSHCRRFAPPPLCRREMLATCANGFGTVALTTLLPEPIGLFPVVGGSADGQVYPRNGGPFGLNGGLWYARIRVKY